MIALVLLFVIGVYIFLAVVIAKAVPGKVTKALILAVFVLIPTWDIIPGQLYFQNLCEKEAGVKVFKVVEVEQSYFRPDGKPDDKKLAERYAQLGRVDANFHPLFHIKKIESSIKDNQTEEVLGTEANFLYLGGWVSAFLLPEGGSSCPAYSHLGLHGALLQGVFRLKPGSIQGGN